MNLDDIVYFIRKNLVLVLAWVCISASLVYVSLNYDKRSFLDSKHQDLVLEHSRVLINLKNGKGIVEDLEKMESLVAEAESRLFRVQDLASNNQYFYRIETETGVEIVDWQQVIEGKGRKKSKAELIKEKRRKYNPVEFQLRIKGTFEDLLAYLRKLERGSSYYRLKKIGLSSASSAEEGKIDMSILCSILSHKDE